MINIEDFVKVELKVGEVLEAEELEGSDKLLKLKVDLGEETPRQILSGIKQYYKGTILLPDGKIKPSPLIGKQFIFVANLEPRMMMGHESAGMILCAEGKKPIPLKPSAKVPNGAKIR